MTFVELVGTLLGDGLLDPDCAVAPVTFPTPASLVDLVGVAQPASARVFS
jgi:hypothetical protein